MIVCGGLLFLLTACVTTEPRSELGLQNEETFLVPKMGFRGVSFRVPEGTDYAAERKELTAADTFLVQAFTDMLLGDEDLDLILDLPLYFEGEHLEMLVIPGFFLDVAGMPGFAHTSEDVRERFLLFSFLGYSRKLIGERGWSYEAKTSGRTYLRVAGQGGAEKPDGATLELRLVLGNSVEFFFVVARTETRPPHVLTEQLDTWMDSLNFRP